MLNVFVIKDKMEWLIELEEKKNVRVLFFFLLFVGRKQNRMSKEKKVKLGFFALWCVLTPAYHLFFIIADDRNFLLLHVEK